MAPITALAPELLQHIIDLSSPADYLALTLTCKTLYSRLYPIALHHQKCHRRYRAVSDTHPSTIPHLVRAILLQGDWIAAWHIRTIEIWGSRAGVDQWKSYRLVAPPGSTSNPGQDDDDEKQEEIVHYNNEGGEPAPLFTSHELSLLMKQMVRVLHMEVHQAEKAIDDIKSWRDRSLAVVLMAACPRLQVIRFVKGNSADNGYTETVLALAQAIVQNGDLPAPERRVPLAWEEKWEARINELDLESRRRPDEGDIWDLEMYPQQWKSKEGAAAGLLEEILSKWPAGFLSVREIVIGMKSRALEEFQGDYSSPDWDEELSLRRAGRVSMAHVGPLLRLPRLKSLWVHGFGEESPEHADETLTQLVLEDPGRYYGLPEACSTVENLVFDCPEGPTLESVQALLKACGTLRHLAFIGGDMAVFDLDIVLESLSIPKKLSTLKSVLLCGTEVQGYRSHMFCPEDYTDFPILTVSALDLCDFGTGFTRPSDLGENQRDELVDYLGEVLHGQDARVLISGSYDEFFEKSLIDNVRQQCWDKCWDRDWMGGCDVAGNLKPVVENEEPFPCGCLPSWENHGQYPYWPEPATTLYLEDMDDWLPPNEQSNPQPRDLMKRPWGELIRLCKLWGVGIHTRTTPAPRVHEVDIPTITSEKDLETSPWYRHPDVERLYFKPHKGIVDDCANCGDCDECYKLHPPEAWARWKEEDAKADEERRKREEEEENAQTSDSDEWETEEDDDETGHEEENEVVSEDEDGGGMELDGSEMKKDD